MSGRRKYPGAPPSQGTALPDQSASFAPNSAPFQPQASQGFSNPQHNQFNAGNVSHGPSQPQIVPQAEMASMSLNPGVPSYPASQNPNPYQNINPQANAFVGAPSITPEAPSLEAYLPEQANLSCPPEFLRLTLGCVPQSQELLNSCQIPFGAIIHPLAETSETPVRF